MVKSFNQPTSPIKLLDRLKQLGKCQYECKWVNNKNYYYNNVYYNYSNVISSDDIPALIEFATNTDYFFTEDHNNWWIPIHAWRLIGRLKIKEAINPLVNNLNNYPNINWCAHELPHVFEMLGKDAVEPLANKLADTSNTEMAQFLIIESMVSIAQANKSCRNYIIDRFTDTLDFENKEAYYLNTGILLNLIRLGVRLGKPIIQAFKEFIEENKILDPGLYTEHIMHDQNNDPFSSLPVSTQLRIGKIGRNDKCPCGSGKKYKKCCLDIV